ncbi:MAG: DUF1593 domain-containing protein [Verrucomicrobiales bacterium]|nr:DUF1593 domain-containing protein [Verrucomicrobiales bacterium]
MKYRTLCFALLGALILSLGNARERVIVLTDISNEPDDEESLVRFLVYSNEYDVEGLVATTSQHLRSKTREDLIQRQISAYSKVRSNLLIHSKKYPKPDHLLKLTVSGQSGYGMESVGTGKSTEGSKLIIEAANKNDPRPLWVSVWGGANTLAQALHDASKGKSERQMKELLSRLRVYTISDQDDAGKWIRKEFPSLSYIVTPSNSWKEYHRATWTGISGDRHYKNGPMQHFDLVDNPWLKENIIENHGPLGKLYPKVAYIMEGDTPSFLGLIKNGLGWSISPSFGGWGGRYVLYKSYAEARPIWTNNHYSRDTIKINNKHYTSDQATIWRWRKDFQHDFAARMDWCITKEYSKANHNPIVVLNGNQSKEVLYLDTRPGSTTKFSAKQSKDPDNDDISYRWIIYHEAGNYRHLIKLSHSEGIETSVTVSDKKTLASANKIHLILIAEDNGSPSLTSYRRAVITVTN